MGRCVHGFEHFFHGVLVFCFFVLSLPDFSEASFSDDVEVVEHIFLNFDGVEQLDSIFATFIPLLNIIVALSISLFFLLLVVDHVFHLVLFKSTLLLSICYKIVGQLVIQVVEVQP